jgi:hypothetical protein
LPLCKGSVRFSKGLKPSQLRGGLFVAAAIVLALALVGQLGDFDSDPADEGLNPTDSSVQPRVSDGARSGEALQALEVLPVKGRAPKTGYSRDEFSSGWGSISGCDLRNLMLARDLVEVSFRDDCIVESGVLFDPYTAERIEFVRGVETSLAVQIDHVVAVSDAWQKGAQQLSAERRYEFYNDPLNLLAVSGSANQQKSDSDAASWLPANRAFRCEFIAIQIAVKQRYELWVTAAERDAMRRVLERCPDQALPR